MAIHKKLRTSAKTDRVELETIDLLCDEIGFYLKEKSGIPVPTLEDFCQKHGYCTLDILNKSKYWFDLACAIDMINTRAIVTLENFLILDTSKIEFKNEDGKLYKLDKKGIVEQLKKLKH